MDRFEAALRPAPELATEPIPGASDPILLERIRREIETGGPLTFARFMEIALYDPERGYYRTAVERPGRAGDFLTAPDLHPVFGATMARQLDEVWRRLGEPARFVVREYGPGSGSLALAALRALAGEGPFGSVARSPGLWAAIRYVPVEVNAHRRADLAARFEGARLGDRIEPDLAPDRPEVGAVIANEFLDALPVHRVATIDGRLRELLVDWQDGGLVEVTSEPTTPALASRLDDEGIVLPEGARGEICLTLGAWIDEVAAVLERGAAIVIDYGHRAAELYGPRRPAGTLLAYAGHRVHDDWRIAVGRQDLTAHVDVSAIERRAGEDGLDVLGVTTQAEFLVGAGAESLVEAVRADPATSFDDWTALRSAVARLLDPRTLGGFQVIVLGRGLAPEPPLSGLAFRVPRG